MLKKTIILLTLLLMLVGCNKKENTQIYEITKLEEIIKIANSINNHNKEFIKEKCLESFLGGYIASLPPIEEKNLNEIIDIDMNKVEYSKVNITIENNKTNAIYIILKTNDNEIKEKLNNYLNNNYKNYQQTNIYDYIIYLYNGANDFNLYEDYFEYEQNVCKE